MGIGVFLQKTTSDIRESTTSTWFQTHISDTPQRAISGLTFATAFTSATTYSLLYTSTDLLVTVKDGTTLGKVHGVGVTTCI